MGRSAAGGVLARRGGGSDLRRPRLPRPLRCARHRHLRQRKRLRATAEQQRLLDPGRQGRRGAARGGHATRRQDGEVPLERPGPVRQPEHEPRRDRRQHDVVVQGPLHPTVHGTGRLDLIRGGPLQVRKEDQRQRGQPVSPRATIDNRGPPGGLPQPDRVPPARAGSAPVQLLGLQRRDHRPYPAPRPVGRATADRERQQGHHARHDHDRAPTTSTSGVSASDASTETTPSRHATPSKTRRCKSGSRT